MIITLHVDKEQPLFFSPNDTMYQDVTDHKTDFNYIEISEF